MDKRIIDELGKWKLATSQARKDAESKMETAQRAAEANPANPVLAAKRDAATKAYHSATLAAFNAQEAHVIAISSH